MQNISGEVVGPFKLNRRLAEGGMASVYEATVVDRVDGFRHNMKVALKITRSDDKVFADLINDEIRTLNDFRHPGVVRICPMILFGRPRYRARAENIEGQPWYFVMELLRGGTVFDFAKQKNSNFSLAWRLELIYQITVILDYLHSRHLAHRDLKPDNIMFRVPPRPNQVPHPVLIDFGLVLKMRLESDRESQFAQSNAATVSHAAPERIERLMTSTAFRDPTSVQVDHGKSDVWSLGIIAYELLVGRHPFDDKYQKSVLQHRILNDPPMPMPPEIPPKVQQLVFSMLEKDSSRRPNTFDLFRMLETEIEFLPPRIENGD